jgi:hypothetical protein
LFRCFLFFLCRQTQQRIISSSSLVSEISRCHWFATSLLPFSQPIVRKLTAQFNPIQISFSVQNEMLTRLPVFY